MLADRTPAPEGSPGTGLPSGLGAHPVVTFRHTPDLWHTLLDDPADRARRAQSSWQSAASIRPVQAIGNTEIALNPRDWPA